MNKGDGIHTLRAVIVLALLGFSELPVCGGEPIQQPLPSPLPVSQYVPPAGRNAELQAFDKAVLFLSATQEPDGHWDAKKAGANADFSGLNGDIASTSLATYALLCSAQGKLQNRDAMMRAKRGLEWLLARIQTDGRIADEAAPGEPVVAQLLASMAFLQSASMSTRNVLREAAGNTTRYAILKMRAANGGYGATPNAAAARADITALATFTFRSARMEEVKFDEANPKVDSEIEAHIKKGVTALLLNPEKKDGLYRLLSTDQAVDWNATVGGALTQVLLLAPPSALSNSMRYIFTEEDKATSTFPALKEKFSWGAGGEGYRALSLWQCSLSIVYLYQEHTKEWKAWTGVAKPILLERQNKDGGWDVGGHDGARGRIWRTGFQAMALTLLAPAPPPPTLPPDDGTPPAAK
jgi:hypothetical protein